jgi:DNA processing protein
MPFSDEQFADLASCFKLAFSGLKKFQPSTLEADKALNAALRWAEASNHHLVTQKSPYYPDRLTHLTDAPPLLFVRGDPQTLKRQGLAIVGSRRASAQGLKIAFDFAKVFALSGLCIHSGLAKGVDTAAHRGALESGIALATVAFVGHGVDVVYPAANENLAEKIANQGCIVSELPLGSAPLPSHFPRRNRLIAALSQSIWVVEAALKSGSLITAKVGLDLGREIYATPGSIFSSETKGCHWLIRQGAGLVETPQDILNELLPNQSVTNTQLFQLNEQSSLNFPIPANLEAIGWSPWWPDSLAQHLGLNSAETAQLLLTWELDGLISRQHDGQICRV